MNETTHKLVPAPADSLHDELRALIASSRQRLAGAVNAELTRLYWNVGQRLRTEVLLGADRAKYGDQLINRLGNQLAQEFGRGFEAKNLRRMVQFAVAFPDTENVASLMRHLSWTHFLQLLPVKTDAARWFYAQQSVESRWSVRELHHQIERKAYERTELAALQAPVTAPTEPVHTSATSPAQVFKDPYFLDFLGLRQGHDEADLEAAILRQLEAFILELGRGFAFVERQKRMVIDGDDFYLDLLFYHRRLRRLVAIELKLGRFKAAHSTSICAGPFGTIFKAKDFRSRGVPIIFLLHVGNSKFLTHKPGFMDEKVWEDFHQPYSVFGGELLVTKLGDPPGTACIYPVANGKAMVTPDVMKMSVNVAAAETKYLMYFFNAPTSKKIVEALCFGVTRLRIDLSMFKTFPIPLPPRDEQVEIVRRVEALFALADRIEARCTAARTQAQRLTPLVLAKAFRGELVPQNPNDEPASALLARIASSNTAVAGKNKRKVPAALKERA